MKDNILIISLSCKHIQRPGIEPGTSAVLKPRHNQLDHLCLRAMPLNTTYKHHKNTNKNTNKT